MQYKKTGGMPQIFQVLMSEKFFLGGDQKEYNWVSKARNNFVVQGHVASPLTLGQIVSGIRNLMYLVPC